MKVLVLSDSHGRFGNALRAAEREEPRMILHLGDGWRDAERLRDAFPGTPLERVPGNCDFRSSEPAEKLLFLEDARVLICHGHTRGVKQSLIQAGCLAEAQNLDAFLFGHTHTPLVDRRGRTLFLNPGSIGDAFRPSYAVLTVEGGAVDGRIVLL